MTYPREQIIAWAREAGHYADEHCEEYGNWLDAERVRFAALIEQATIERCAKVCEGMDWSGRSHEAILKGDSADECAAAIRALKKEQA